MDGEARMTNGHVHSFPLRLRRVQFHMGIGELPDVTKVEAG